MLRMHWFLVLVSRIPILSVGLSSRYTQGSLLKCLVGFMCLFGAPIANRIGLDWTLLLGAIGYPIYSLVCALLNGYDSTVDDD